MDFWAFPAQQPGTIRIALGQAKKLHHIRVQNKSSCRERVYQDVV